MQSVGQTGGRALLVPPVNVEYGRLPPYVAYGLFSLESIANGRGHAVDVLPVVPLWEDGRTFATSEEVATTVADLIPTDRYPVVGFSTMCSSFHHTLNVIQVVKRRSPQTRIWVGGPHASVRPEAVLAAYPEVEAVFVGEAELTFAAALERCATSSDSALDGIPGVCVRGFPFVGRELIADLDDLPYVDEAPGFLPAFAAARAAGLDEPLPVEAERGCSGRCAFCSTKSFWGRRVRRKSDTRIVEEMHRLNRATGMRAFTLLGDNLANPRRRLLSLCETLRDQAPAFTWNGQFKLDRLNESDLDVLWSGGCRGFFVGVESASQTTLERIGKDVDLERELRVILAAVDRGFKVVTSFIIGFPWETRVDIDATYHLHVQLLKRGVFHSLLTSLSPLPGTELAERYQPNLLTRKGVSLTARDDLAYGLETIALMDRCPELFTQLDHVEAGASRVEIAAVARAGLLMTSYHGMGRHTPA